jgi:hypothetical protein
MNNKNNNKNDIIKDDTQNVNNSTKLYKYRQKHVKDKEPEKEKGEEENVIYYDDGAEDDSDDDLVVVEENGQEYDTEEDIYDTDCDEDDDDSDDSDVDVDININKVNNNCTFIEFYKKDYMSVKKNIKLLNDVTNMFNNLDKNNEKLTDNEISKYINKITNGRSRSLLARDNGSDNSLLIEKLLSKHTVSSSQLNKILLTLKLCRNDQTLSNMNWVKMLIDKKYKFTIIQKTKLRELDYEVDKKEDIIKKLKKADIVAYERTQKLYMDLLISYFSGKNIRIEDVSDRCIDHKMIPNDDCLIAIFKNSTVSWTDVPHYINEFLLLGYQPTSKILYEILKCCMKSAVRESIIDSLKALCILTIDNGQLNNEVKNYILKNLFYFPHNIITFFVQHDIAILNKKTIKMLIKKTTYDDFNNQQLIQQYNYLSKELYDQEICDEICRIGDECYFKFLVNNQLFKTSNNSLKYGCLSGSLLIIDDLLNMKVLPDTECLYYLNKNMSTKILPMLITYGLPLNHTTIYVLYSLDMLLISDLEKYDIKADDKLYLEFHKQGKSNFKKAYKILFNNPLTIFRESFATDSIDDIIYELKEHNMKLDQFCYDIARESNPVLADWLETEYNMKPTPITFIRISDSLIKNKLYIKYFKDIFNSKHDTDDINKLYLD